MRLRQWVLAGHFAAALLALAAIAAPARAARTLISPKPIDRPYPTFAGIVIGSFRPTCSQVTIHAARRSGDEQDSCWYYLCGGTFDVLCVAESASVAANLTAGDSFFNGRNADGSGHNSNTQNLDWRNRTLPVRWESSPRNWKLYGQARWQDGLQLLNYGDSATVVVTGLTPGLAYTLYGTTSPISPPGYYGVCTNLIAWVTDDTSSTASPWPVAPEVSLPVLDLGTASTIDAAPAPAGGAISWGFTSEPGYMSRMDSRGRLATSNRLIHSSSLGLTAPGRWCAMTDARGNSLILLGERRPGFGGSVIAARRVDPEGYPLPGWPSSPLASARVVLDAQEDQDEPTATPTSDGGAILAWADTRHAPGTRTWQLHSSVFAEDVYSLDRADLDGDGDDEVISVQISRDSLEIFDVRQGALAKVVTLPTRHNPYACRSADLNNDGLPDLVVACGNSDSLDLFLSTSTPFGFTHSWRGSAGRAVDLRLVDVNNDGLLDIVHTRPADSTVVVRRGLGGGTFTPPSAYKTPGEPQFLATGDFDGDGLVDLAVLSYLTPGIVRAFRNLGGGVFAAAGDRQVGSISHAIVAGQFDGDSRDDVAVAPGLGGTSTAMQILHGGSSGNLLGGGTSTLTLSGKPYTLVADDFDRDGWVDIAAAYASSPSAPQICWGSPLGPDAAVGLPTYARAACIVAADLDGDGTGEILHPDANGDNAELLVLRNVKTRRDIYALRVQPDGTPATGWPTAGLALATDGSDVTHLHIAPDGADGAYVAFDRVEPLYGGAWIQHVRSNGVLAAGWPDSSAGGAPVDLSPATHRVEDLVRGNTDVAGNGGATVAFLTDVGDPWFQEARVARISGAGTVSWMLSLGDGSFPRLARWPDGSVQVVWRSVGGALRTTRLTATGAAQPGWALSGVLLSASADSVPAAAALSDSAHVMIAWSEPTGVRVRRFGADAVTGTWAASIAVMVEPSTRMIIVPGTEGAGILVASTATEVVAQRLDPAGALGDLSPALDRATDWRADQGGIVRVSWLPSQLERSTAFASHGGLYRLYTVAANGTRTLVSTKVSGSGCSYWADIAVPGVARAAEGAVAPFTVFELETFDPVTGESRLAPRDSAFSVDDIPPPAPTAFSSAFTASGPGTGITEFDWTPTPVGDLAEYRIFGSPDSLFWSHMTTTPAPASHANAPTPAGRMFFRLYAADIHGNTSAPASPVFQLGAPGTGAPLTLSFAPPSPSPARTSTRMRLSLPARAQVELTAFDLLGRRVRRIAEGERSAGLYDLSWDLRDDEGRALAPGLYLVRLRTQGHEFRHRVLVVR